MKEYRTIIIVNKEINQKIELYRQFLEKSEFKTCLDNGIFLTEDSVEELHSTELNIVENFIYLYGVINKEQYDAYYNEITTHCRKYQNAHHYMLFCSDPYQEKPYNASERTSNILTKPLSIGILSENISEQTEAMGLQDDLNCLKLLTLALAIGKFNENNSKAVFESYYMCAKITLDYKKIYYAIMHRLCKEADLINCKELEIKKNIEMIEYFRKKSAQKCEGNYETPDDAATETGLKDKFSDYKNPSDLLREMEVAYRIGSESMQQSIAQKIDIARCALAIEEQHTPTVTESVIDGKYDVTFDDDTSFKQEYMTLTVVPKEREAQEVAQPKSLLEKPIDEKIPDSMQITALLPLIKEFEQKRKFNVWYTVLAALFFAITFFALSGLVYYLRYKTTGLIGVTKQDIINTVGIPAITLLLTGLVGIIIQLIRYFLSRSILKTVYKNLKAFLDGRLSTIEKIKRYINKYLTVYYNYHIKHSRIDKLEETNISLENEIRLIRERFHPVENVAETICNLNGERIQIPQIIPDDDDVDKTKLRKMQLENDTVADTNVIYSDTTIKTITPWASEIVYNVGNMNDGGGR